MTTVTISDALAARLRALHNYDKGDDFNKLVEIALDEAARRWEWEAAGRAAMAAMLNGPRHAAAEVAERVRLKYDYPALSAMTPQELAEDAERVVAAMDPPVRAEMERDGWL